MAQEREIMAANLSGKGNRGFFMPIAFGFECGDGWFELLAECIKALELECMKIEDPKQRPTASQIKEKYGTLRFYISGYTDDMGAIINKAEQRSAETCEKCGAPGETNDGGWLSTLCDPCRNPKEAA